MAQNGAVKPMLVFVIPLKSRETSKSWPQVCKLLERCVQSICRQTVPNFKVVVVCNQRPELEFSHPALHYVEVDFPIPEPNCQSRNIDKSKKIITGLLYARQFSPTHVMLVDADDCVSHRLAAFTNQHPEANGWFLDKGYVYQENSRLIYYRKLAFNNICGTCNILRFDLCPLPSESLQVFTPELIDFYSGKSHRDVEKVMQAQQTPLTALPFIGAVYIIGNGENIYQDGFATIYKGRTRQLMFRLKEAIRFRWLTPGMRKEFSLYSV
jgi:hypothetical protein